MDRTNSCVNDGEQENKKELSKSTKVIAGTLGFFSGALYLHASDPAISRYLGESRKPINQALAWWIRIGATLTNGAFNAEAYLELFKKNTVNQKMNCFSTLKKIISIIIAIAAVLPSWHIAYNHINHNEQKKILVCIEAILNIPINLHGVDEIFNGFSIQDLGLIESNALPYIISYSLIFIPLCIATAWQNTGFTAESYEGTLTFIDLIGQSNDTILAKAIAGLIACFNLLPCIYYTMNGCSKLNKLIDQALKGPYDWKTTTIYIMVFLLAVVSGFTSDQVNYNVFENPFFAIVSAIIGNIGAALGYNAPQAFILVDQLTKSKDSNSQQLAYSRIT